MDRRAELHRQLMTTFQAELEDHLKVLNSSLLTLERGPMPAERDMLLAEAFRAAHSLKGAARAVEIEEIETIAHRLEDALGAIQKLETPPPQGIFDRLFPAVDALREAMAAHLRGEHLLPGQYEPVLLALTAVVDLARPGDTQLVIPPLQNSPDPTVSTLAASTLDLPHPSALPSMPVEHELSNHEMDSLQPQSQISPPPPINQSSHGEQPQLISRPAAHTVPQEHTIRVATQKLDALMSGMGELVAIRLRAEQRLAEMRALQQRLNRLDKSWRKARGHFHRLQRQRDAVLYTAHVGSTADQEPPADTAPGCPPSGRIDAEMVPVLEYLAGHEDHLKALKAQQKLLLSNYTSDYHRLALLLDDLQDVVRRTRMLPIGTILEPYPRMVRDLARQQGKDIRLNLEGAETEVDRQILETIKDPLTHLLRNAVDHGIEMPEQRAAAGKSRQGTIWLRTAQKGNRIEIEVADDGQGLDLATIRSTAVDRHLLSQAEAASLEQDDTVQLIFQPGFTTRNEVTDLSGRGFGLDVVRQKLEQLHGLVEVRAESGRGASFVMTVPLTLAATQILLVRAADQTLGFPTTAIDRIVRIDPQNLGSVDGRPAFSLHGRMLTLNSLAQVLHLPGKELSPLPGQKVPVVILGAAEKRMAFKVDALLGTLEVVIKNLGKQLLRVRNIMGAAILGSGQVVVILNSADLIKSAQTRPVDTISSLSRVDEKSRCHILVVDDSITTRTLEKNILEAAGYQVWVASNGQEGWALVQSQFLDAIVTDINMPVMDGIALTKKVKGDDRYKNLPVVLVTSLESTQDKINGLEAGADAYIVKRSFDHQELLQALDRLIV